MCRLARSEQTRDDAGERNSQKIAAHRLNLRRIDHVCPGLELYTIESVNLHHRNFRAVTGDREFCAPAICRSTIMKISEKYRAKALDCEKLALAANKYHVKCAWAEIAIE